MAERTQVQNYAMQSPEIDQTLKQLQDILVTGSDLATRSINAAADEQISRLNAALGDEARKSKAMDIVGAEQEDAIKELQRIEQMGVLSTIEGTPDSQLANTARDMGIVHPESLRLADEALGERKAMNDYPYLRQQMLQEPNKNPSVILQDFLSGKTFGSDAQKGKYVRSLAGWVKQDAMQYLEKSVATGNKIAFENAVAALQRDLLMRPTDIKQRLDVFKAQADSVGFKQSDLDVNGLLVRDIFPAWEQLPLEEQKKIDAMLNTDKSFAAVLPYWRAGLTTRMAAAESKLLDQAKVHIDSLENWQQKASTFNMYAKDMESDSAASVRLHTMMSIGKEFDDKIKSAKSAKELNAISGELSLVTKSGLMTSTNSKVKQTEVNDKLREFAGRTDVDAILAGEKSGVGFVPDKSNTQYINDWAKGREAAGHTLPQVYTDMVRTFGQLTPEYAERLNSMLSTSNTGVRKLPGETDEAYEARRYQQSSEAAAVIASLEQTNPGYVRSLKHDNIQNKGSIMAYMMTDWGVHPATVADDLVNTSPDTFATLAKTYDTMSRNPKSPVKPTPEAIKNATGYKQGSKELYENYNTRLLYEAAKLAGQRPGDTPENILTLAQNTASQAISQKAIKADLGSYRQAFSANATPLKQPQATMLAEVWNAALPVIELKYDVKYDSVRLDIEHPQEDKTNWYFPASTDAQGIIGYFAFPKDELAQKQANDALGYRPYMDYIQNDDPLDPYPIQILLKSPNYKLTPEERKAKAETLSSMFRIDMKEMRKQGIIKAGGWNR